MYTAVDLVAARPSARRGRRPCSQPATAQWLRGRDMNPHPAPPDWERLADLQLERANTDMAGEQGRVPFSSVLPTPAAPSKTLLVFVRNFA